ncbi:MAG: alkaline phosphatase family protein, partial [Planctomycetota bacterium]
MVVISVDQLCYEYLERFRNNFTPDGFFQRCSNEGTWFTECHHRHAYTVTAPGHAVLMTGNYPGPLGIIDNTWYDRRLGKEVYCVEDLNYPIVGTPPTQAELKGVSPLKMHAETVGDVLKRTTGGQAKVFGVTLKDRAAVLMSGKQADSAYWFDPNSGNWVTSRYYRAALPDYLIQLNEGDTAKCYAGSRWQLLYPAEKYSPRHADDAPFEGNYEKLGRAFPHEFVSETNTQYYKQILCSPFGNEMTLQVAQLLIEREHLGQDEIPDILNLGFSANDYVGHNFGPHSLEVEDITYRTDLLLGSFLRMLDDKVGVGKWVCVLSADHAVTPIPEYAQTIGLPARRNPLGDLAKLRTKIEQTLVDKFGPPPTANTYLERLTSRELFLSTRLIESVEPTQVAQYRTIARDCLAQEAGVALAFTREELISSDRTAPDIPAARIAPPLHNLIATGSEPLSLFRRSFNPRLSGDVVFCLPPYCIQGSTPATHGLPYRTDSHVPLLW